MARSPPVPPVNGVLTNTVPEEIVARESRVVATATPGRDSPTLDHGQSHRRSAPHLKERGMLPRLIENLGPGVPSIQDIDK
jgi:hypothetical protein